MNKNIIENSLLEFYENEDFVGMININRKKHVFAC